MYVGQKKGKEGCKVGRSVYSCVLESFIKERFAEGVDFNFESLLFCFEL